MYMEILLLLLGGLLGGTLGGLLGIGGGIVLMPILRFMVGLSPTLAAGVCSLAVLFTTLGGSYRHYRMGNVDLRSIWPLIVSGACATVVFSLVFPHFSGHEQWLDLAVGIVFVLISLRMVVEGVLGFGGDKEEEDKGPGVSGALAYKISIGSVAGALSGLLGIGSGVILVPAFTYVLYASMKVAIASSLTCFAVNAFISSAFKFGQGFIDPEVALPLCLGTLLGANLGAILNSRFSHRSLKFFFGLIFSYVSVKFILSFLGAM